MHMNDRVQQRIAKLNKMATATINDRETLTAIDRARFDTMQSLNDAMRDLETATSKPTLAQKLRGVVKSPEVATLR